MKPIQSFFLGILAAISALFLEIISLSFLQSFSTAENELFSKELFSFGYLFFIVILIEEFLKFIVIYKAVPKEKNIVFNSLFFGIGFSVLELALVFWNNGNEITDTLGTGGIFLIHVSTSLLFGFLMQNARKLFSYFPIFIMALVIHSTYNILSASEIDYRKPILFGILALLILLDVFLILKSGFRKLAKEISPNELG